MEPNSDNRALVVYVGFAAFAFLLGYIGGRRTPNKILPAFSAEIWIGLLLSAFLAISFNALLSSALRPNYTGSALEWGEQAATIQNIFLLVFCGSFYVIAVIGAVIGRIQGRNKLRQNSSGAPLLLTEEVPAQTGEVGQLLLTDEYVEPDESAPGPGYKECPRCAEHIRQKAVYCRFCGADLE